MKKLTLTLLSGTLLFASATALAADPATSTSTKQIEHEQLNNPGHITDDCRAAENENKKDCQTGHEMSEEHKDNEKKVKEEGSMDNVTQKDSPGAN